VPRPRAAAGGDGARVGRGSLDVRLGAIRRRHRAEPRHAFLRGVGPAEGARQEIWFHTGTRRGGGAAAARAGRGEPALTRGGSAMHSPTEHDAIWTDEARARVQQEFGWGGGVLLEKYELFLAEG